MSWRTLSLILSVAACLGGCGTAAILKGDATDPGPDESIIVIGARPDGTTLHFLKGTSSSTGVSVDRWWGSPEVNGTIVDGYLVARAKAGQTLVLSDVFTASRAHYPACIGHRALTFEVPRGQVAYLTDVEFEESNRKLWLRYSDRLAAAREHMRDHYPRVTQTVQQAAAQALPVESKCLGGGVTIVPIYIGR